MLYPNLKQSVSLLVLLLLYQIILTTPIAMIGAIIDYKLHQESYIIGIISMISCYLALRYVAKKNGKTELDILPLKKIPWQLIGPISISIIGLGVMISLVSNVTMSLLPPPEYLDKILQELLGKKASFHSAFFLSVIQAPITEEIIFRGIILSGLLTYYTSKRAIFWSAILFGVFHLNPWQLPIAFLIGLVLGWWVIQTGSLLPALLGHALHNFIILSSIHLIDQPSEINEVVFQPWWWNMCGVILLAIGLWWFQNIIQKKQPRYKPQPTT